jgi:hypothetical protein
VDVNDIEIRRRLCAGMTAREIVRDRLGVMPETVDAFCRNVDVVEKRALRNPFRRFEILTTRRVVYAA